MLRLALLFLIISLAAGALGFTGVAGASAGIAKFIFILFLAVFFCAILMIALGINLFTG